MTLAYDGTNYKGWQKQKKVSTIQETLEIALFQITGKAISVVGAGRTDANVHAKGQVAHFFLDAPFSKKLLNPYLPQDIRVLSLEEKESSFHARFSAIEKCYLYHVSTKPVPSPFQRRYLLHHPYPVDLKKIDQAIPYFIGTKDFRSFVNKSSSHQNCIRTIFSISLVETAYGFFLKFRGDGFLYKMIRNLTGSLLEVGQNKLCPSQLPSIFEKKSRFFAARTAPPHALFLEYILY